MRSRTGKPLTLTSFQRALPNTVYIGQYRYNGEVVPGLAEALVDEAVFAKAQEHLAFMARSPGARKARVDYLLQGKGYCGCCGMPMLGECGRSHTGQVYNYYSCAGRKRRHACKKKNERKDFIEWYVVEQTLQYVLSPLRIARVAEAVVAQYHEEFSNSRVEELERALAQIDRELDKLVDALVDAPKIAHQKIYARMETLESQKAELDADIAKLRIAQRIVLTEAEVKSWLRQFCAGDPLDEQFRRRIIDVFINAVYLYDDRVIIFYNIRGGKQVSYIDLCNTPATAATAADTNTPTPATATTATNAPATSNTPIPTNANSNANTKTKKAPKSSSDLNANGEARSIKFEPHYIFVNGIFGCIYYRSATDEINWK